MGVSLYSQANRPVRASSARIERVLGTLMKTLPPATVTQAPASEEASPCRRYAAGSLKGGWMLLSGDTPVRPTFPLYAGHSRPDRGGSATGWASANIATTDEKNRFMRILRGGMHGTRLAFSRH